ncbi:MAG: 6-carboxytetrahydropterin synthase [Zoogloea sp.]|jgi:6-pyruvoyltetrahydropterin/6-carboxytetrahydropterin synthase|nr:6-carboxytetrahydropterin synthase [Zoogloea sp.]TXG95120.1 MAG: 6-carboxytetrahydropterin synthase [Zoogloea sp.]
MHELSRAFLFEAAHTLQRDIGTEGSRRIHGHSYRATITLAGVPDPVTGMLIDIGHLDTLLADTRDALDHRFLDEVPGLGPATLENLCSFLWARLAPSLPQLHRVTVSRDLSGDACSFVGQAVC